MMQTTTTPDVPNCRELGGIPAAGGRCVRRGVLWRSAHLFGLSARSRQQLAALGITRIIDLRAASERAWEPDAPIGARAIHLPIEPLVGL